MQLPIELKFIRQGAVFYMVDRRLSSTEPHYFIVLNRDPYGDKLLLLAVASSQVEKVRARRKRKSLPPETVVEISPSDYQDFKVDSCVNCNTVFTKSLVELADQWKRKEIRGQADLGDTILQQLITGIMASPMIPEEEKKLVSDC
ncbi:hypothetical protein [Oceaniferula spumae]|uniref:hypothetical protein n=1 Tax=Oceaniferula spumae TaxID=2979115 RepID=UPI003F4E50C1